VMLTSLPETVYSYGPKTAAVSSAAPHSRTARTASSPDRARAALVHCLEREPDAGAEGCRTCNRSGGPEADADRESVQKSIDMRRVGCRKSTCGQSRNRARNRTVFVKIPLQPAQQNHPQPERRLHPTLPLTLFKIRLLHSFNLQPTESRPAGGVAAAPAAPERPAGPAPPTAARLVTVQELVPERFLQLRGDAWQIAAEHVHPVHLLHVPA
jgi:hypothetical protein